MGQNTPAKDDISEQWIGDNVYAMKTGDTGQIMDLSKNVLYMINHKDKSYVEAPLPLDIAKLLPPEMAAMASMIIMKATVAPTGETKKSGSWNCQGYDMTMSVMGMPMKTKIWASTDVPFDTAKFTEKMMPAIMQGSLNLDASSLKELAKIKGMQISTEMNGEMMGAKIRAVMEVVEISKKNAPAGTYTLPAGYKKNTTKSLGR